MANPFLVKDSIAATVATTTTWFDSSSNSLDLTATNSPTLDTLGDATSEYNPFWTLDGVDQYLFVANDANLNFGANTDFSLGCGFRTTTDGRLIEKGSSSGTDARYVLQVLSDKLQASTKGGGTSAFVPSATSVNDGKWHHGAATFDRDGNITVYV
ncbi:hypothetical protein LCGC14_1265980, partial [marine sediment metagenome]